MLSVSGFIWLFTIIFPVVIFFLFLFLFRSFLVFFSICWYLPDMENSFVVTWSLTNLLAYLWIMCLYELLLQFVIPVTFVVELVGNFSTEHLRPLRINVNTEQWKSKFSWCEFMRRHLCKFMFWVIALLLLWQVSNLKVFVMRATL